MLAQFQTEGRYLAENMDKFFTDFHKAQQIRMMGERQHSMLAADRLEMEHKHRSDICISIVEHISDVARQSFGWKSDKFLLSARWR